MQPVLLGAAFPYHFKVSLWFYLTWVVLGSQIAAVNNGVCGSCSSSTVLALAAPGKGYSGAKGKQVMKIMAAAAATGRVPDIEKRNLMNLLLLGALGLPTLGALGPYVYFFVPPRYTTNFRPKLIESLSMMLGYDANRLNLSLSESLPPCYSCEETPLKR